MNASYGILMNDDLHKIDKRGRIALEWRENRQSNPERSVMSYIFCNGIIVVDKKLPNRGICRIVLQRIRTSLSKSK